MRLLTTITGVAVAAAVAGITLSGAPAAAQERNNPDLPDTIYVPYKDLEKIFEKEGRGVFLPYKEFLKLWKSNRPPELDPTSKPPVAAAITGAAYDGTVSDTVARLTARYEVRVLADGWQGVTLNFGGLALSDVRIEPDNGALVTSGPKGTHQFLAPKPGLYRLEVDLAAPVTESPGQRTVSLRLPPAPQARLSLVLPGKDSEVELTPSLAKSIGPGEAADTTRLLAFLGMHQKLDVKWKPRTKIDPNRKAKIHATVSSRTKIEMGAIEVSAVVDYKILQAPADRFTLQVPAAYGVRDLTGKNIRDWTAQVNQGVRTLTVLLHSPVEKQYQLKLVLDRLIPDVTAGDLAVPQVVATGAEREDGTVAVWKPATLDLQLLRKDGLDQVQPGRNESLKFTYRGGTRALTLRISKIEPRIHAEVATRFSIGETRRTVESALNLTVTRAGIFAVETKVPKGWDVIAVGPDNVVDDHRVAQRDDHQLLTIDLRRQTTGRINLTMQLQQRATKATGTFPIPSIEVLKTEKQTGALAVAIPSLGYKAVTVADTLKGYIPVDLNKVEQRGVRPGRGESLKLGFQYNRHPLAGSVLLEQRAPQVTARVSTLVEVEKDVLRTTYRVTYDIKHAGVKELQFALPADADPDGKLTDSIEGAGVKSTPAPEELAPSAAGMPKRLKYRVLLQDATAGAYVLTIKQQTKLPKSLEPAKAATLPVHRLDLLGIFSARGEIGVTKQDDVVAGVATPVKDNMVGYLGLDAREIEDPVLKQRQSDIVLALRWAGDEPTRALRLHVIKYDFAATVQTAVKLMHTDVNFTDAQAKAETFIEIQNNARQNFTIDLPPGSKLEQVEVAGEVRNPSKTQDNPNRYTIDLSPPSGGRAPARGAAFIVRVLYQLPGSGWELALPQIVIDSTDPADAIPVAASSVECRLPKDGWAYLGYGGDLQQAQRRHGIWRKIDRLWAWLGDAPHPDTIGRAEWQAARNLRERAHNLPSTGMRITLPLASTPGRTEFAVHRAFFFKSALGGRVSVTAMGHGAHQFLKVLFFLAAIGVAVWYPLSSQTGRLLPTAAPAGAALLLAAIWPAIGGLGLAVVTGAMIAAVFWIFYTVLFEIPAAWREGGGGGGPAPAPPAPPTAGPAPSGPGTSGALPAEGYQAGGGTAEPVDPVDDTAEPDGADTADAPADAYVKKAAKKAAKKTAKSGRKKAAKKSSKSSKKKSGKKGGDDA
ncbi:MAG: hypothetical protein ACYTGX_02455 [Planctomycetota bacterium]|jgi:hypothetical protein